LHAFDDLGIKPSRIAGTSIGALMGVAYAAGLTAQVIEDHARSVLSNRLDAARLAFSSGKGGVLDLVRFNPLSNPLVDGPQLVRLVLPDGVPDRLDHLAIPMDVVACDFYGAREISLSSGPTVEAVAASIAIPGLISAPAGDETLIDGGCVNPVPINHLQDLDIVAAVDVVGRPEPRGGEAPRTPDLMAGAMQIQQRMIASPAPAQQPLRHMAGAGSQPVPRARVLPFRGDTDRFETTARRDENAHSKTRWKHESNQALSALR
jgi:NTE family protein